MFCLRERLGVCLALGGIFLAGIALCAEPSDLAVSFETPPSGYGEVPFWWWTGDPLDEARLAWQIERLHEKGVAGMQVNYAHQDTPGWPTYPNQPEIFSAEWWKVWEGVVAECRKRGMSVGLSTYTLDWIRSKNLFQRIVYEDPAFQARTLEGRRIETIAPGAVPAVEWTESEHSLGFWAFPMRDGKQVGDGRLVTASTWSEVRKALGNTEIQLWEFSWRAHPDTLNPLHPEAGKRVVEKFYQPFLDHNGGSSEGLNWFFNDELQLGVEGVAWCDDFPERFRQAKGYDLFPQILSLFDDVEAKTPKVRMDVADVRMSLSEERYFQPIFQWHQSRGLIFGCDNNGRGTNPMEYGDYFRAVRWYTAPGHDTPGGRADFIKGKVSSSIAALYRRPRVWLEGYHSFGWGATPQDLFFATCENYVYGCTLLNLHGLYYTTHGSFWEWAPPCYHFRMPYWEHFGAFLKYFERLSFLLSQGVWQSEIAIQYPTAPGMAGLDANQKRATELAFSAARTIYASGRDVTFMDDDSLLRAEIWDGRLHVSDMAFSVYVLPGVEAIRWECLQKLRQFADAGGTVLCLERRPTVSDRAGAQDAELDQLAATFSVTPFEQLTQCAATFPQDVQSAPGGKFLHRRVGEHEIYWLMEASSDTPWTFRATGRVELWNPADGRRTELPVLRQAEGRTTLRIPETPALIVFSPGVASSISTPSNAPEQRDKGTLLRRLDGPWEFRLVPTLDNRWGDFRLPVTDDNRMIGVEARRFRYYFGGFLPEMTQTDFDDSDWHIATCGFGEAFRLAKSDQPLPSVAAIRHWTAESFVPYVFSWRTGVEGNPGHQGWHGLKEQLDDRFITLGATREGHNETLFCEEDPPQVYYLTAFVNGTGMAKIVRGGNLPSRVWRDGELLVPETETVLLDGRPHEWILEYTTAGRGWWFLEQMPLPGETVEKSERTPLSMTWYDRPFLPFATHGGMIPAVYRFTAPAGLRRLTMILDERATLPEVYVSGQKYTVHSVPALQKRTRRAVCELPKAMEKSAVVALVAQLPEAVSGGALFPEPICLETDIGVLDTLGDWSQDGTVLDTFSGAAVYTQTFSLTEAERATGRVRLNLNAVSATASVRLNGQNVGVLFAAPWTLDVTEFLCSGENRLEIEVRNTLANHFQTVPTRYRGSPRSGLIGPVELWILP